MTLFVKTFSLALQSFPILNSTYDVSQPYSFKMHAEHNISIALDSPFGLVVPNIKRV
jgi:2-oxoisovalerate dehydrogenase E2 component (dihydrolipoyl transacylase)